MNHYKTAIIFIIATLTACLFVYILTGFISIFNEKGPLSAIIGACASIVTCAIAIRAIFIAKKWHLEKFKTQVFEGACSYHELINSTPAVVSFLHMNLDNRVDFLNYKLKHEDNFNPKSEVFHEINDFLKLTFNVRFETYQSIIKNSKYQKYVEPEYRSFCAIANRKLARFLGGLETPIQFRENLFRINPKAMDAYNILNSDESGDLFNKIAPLPISKFINLTEATAEVPSKELSR